MQKFDVILSNAPYNNGLHVKFSIKYFDICDGEICWVSPLSFLLGKKQNKKLTVHLDKYRTDIEQINGNEYFDAAIGGTMGIVHVDMSDKYLHYVKFDGKEYEKCEEISRISNDDLLMEFKSTIDIISNKSNLDSIIHYREGVPQDKNKIEKHPNLNWWCLRILPLRGHKGTNDFYTLISNNPKEINKNKGQYKELSNIKTVASNTGQYKNFLEYYFAFDTENELNNFINYCKTDFVRCCCFIYKTTMNILRGELTKIPKFDFSNPIFSKSPSEIDDYLFDKFNISDEIRKHIEEILPDYYGIRNIRV